MRFCGRLLAYMLKAWVWSLALQNKQTKETNTSSKQQTTITRAWRPLVTDFTVDWCDVGSTQCLRAQWIQPSDCFSSFYELAKPPFGNLFDPSGAGSSWTFCSVSCPSLLSAWFGISPDSTACLSSRCNPGPTLVQPWSNPGPVFLWVREGDCFPHYCFVRTISFWIIQCLTSENSKSTQVLDIS